MVIELTATPTDVVPLINAGLTTTIFVITAEFDSRTDAFLRYELSDSSTSPPDPLPTRTPKIRDGESIRLTRSSGSIWMWNEFHAIAPAGISICNGRIIVAP